MRRIRITMIVLNPILTVNLFSLEERTDGTNVKLPVHRVVLYKKRVGISKHTGKVYGNQAGEHRLHGRRNSMIVLKSMTVCGPFRRDTSSGVNYNSVAPLDERLRTLRLPLAPPPRGKSSSMHCAEQMWKSKAMERPW